MHQTDGGIAEYEWVPRGKPRAAHAAEALFKRIEYACPMNSALLRCCMADRGGTDLGRFTCFTP